MDRLPPLNAVRAFEAAARHLSIARAADELCVTPGAVSRQVALLEEFLSVQLLVRGHRQIALTQQGLEYYSIANDAIALIRRETDRLRKVSRSQLKIRAYTTFALRWLIPRLSRFHELHPKVQLRLSTSVEKVDFSRDDIDGAIRLGDGRWPSVVAGRVSAHKLVPNVLVPVTSPQLVASEPPLRRPMDLVNHTLLHSVVRPDDWAYWLRAVGIDRAVDPHSGLSYDSSALAYVAAEQGQGVAIAQQFLVDADLQSGKLVRPFEEQVDMGDFTYYLLVPADRAESADMRSFRIWLIETLGAG